MNFNKPMIDLVREIRRRVPSEIKPAIKLANPELFNELVPAFHSSKDTILKTLIKELFTIAEDGWIDKLQVSSARSERPAEKSTNSGRFVTRVYRGQTQLVEIKDTASATAKQSQKMYRGQPVPA